MTPPDTKRRLHLDPNLHIVFAVTLMAVMGVSNITPAFPRMARDLNVTSTQIGYLIVYFTLPGVFLAPILGVLADRLGRKRILAPSLFLFGIAGTACAFVRDFDLLLTLRFVQGIGAAALGALNQTILGDLYSGKRRTEAIGYNASVLSVGTAAYPLIGGGLAMLGWYYPFLLSITAIPVGLMVMHWLESPEPTNVQRIGTYFAHVWRNLRTRSIAGLFIGSLVSFIVLYGSYLTYLPFLIATSFKGSPFVIGLIISASSVSNAFSSAQLGRLARRFPEKRLLAFGYVVYTVSLVLIPFVKSLWLLLVPSVLYGVAGALNMPNISTLIAALAPASQRAAIMSINGMVLRLGQTLGPLIMAGVFGLWGFPGVYFVGAIFTLGMFFVAVMLIEQPKEEAHEHPSLSAGTKP